MPFKKIKARVKNCRGSGDEFVLAQFEENFEAWQSTVDGLSKTEKDNLADAFNSVCDGIGDALLDDKDIFVMAKADLSADQTKQFCALLTREYFELEE